jgi:ADP-heptose:LPS heptosyltransferase
MRMGNLLIIKLGATGDVVRTTPLLGRLRGEITWVTAAKNTVLLRGLETTVRCIAWEDRAEALDTTYDLIINLEDTVEAAEFVRQAGDAKIIGAYLETATTLKYTEDCRAWFDLSLISSYGRKEADRLKLLNRRTYQEMIFEALGFRFAGEKYLLPEPAQTDLSGDVAVAAEAGPVWPMKNWAYFDTLIKKLREEGFIVNVLPKRTSLLEHLADVRNHRCLVGGDSLPMHFALGTGTRCVNLFTCTSPWEIHDYGIQIKVISPLLEEFFYQRGYDRRATTAISVEDVRRAVLTQIDGPAAERRLPHQALR